MRRSTNGLISGAHSAGFAYSCRSLVIQTQTQEIVCIWQLCLYSLVNCFPFIDPRIEACRVMERLTIGQLTVVGAVPLKTRRVGRPPPCDVIVITWPSHLQSHLSYVEPASVWFVRWNDTIVSCLLNAPLPTCYEISVQPVCRCAIRLRIDHAFDKRRTLCKNAKIQRQLRWTLVVPRARGRGVFLLLPFNVAFVAPIFMAFPTICVKKTCFTKETQVTFFSSPFLPLRKS